MKQTNAHNDPTNGLKGELVPVTSQLFPKDKGKPYFSLKMSLQKTEAAHICTDFHRMILIVVQIPPETGKAKLPIFRRFRMQNVQIFDVALELCSNHIHLH